MENGMKFDLVVKSDFNIQECNIDAIKEGLESLMQEKYNIVVTDDTVKSSKNVMAEINKGKKAILDAWKIEKERMNAPIKELDNKIKELVSICDDARGRIELQVNEFENGKRELAQRVCEDYKNELCKIHGLNAEDIPLVGFNNLTFVSDKGAITSTAKQKVENIVLQEVARLREIETQQEAERQRIREIEESAIKKYQEENKILQQENSPIEEMSQIKDVERETKAGQDVFSFQAVFRIKTSTLTRNQVMDRLKNEISKNPLLKEALASIG